MALVSGGGAAAGVARPPLQADQARRLALLASIAIRIDGKQLGAPCLTMDAVGALMLSLDESSSSDRTAAIAGLLSACEAGALVELSRACTQGVPLSCSGEMRRFLENRDRVMQRRGTAGTAGLNSTPPPSECAWC
jgi:hypothetical protein